MSFGVSWYSACRGVIFSAACAGDMRNKSLAEMPPTTAPMIFRRGRLFVSRPLNFFSCSRQLGTTHDLNHGMFPR